MTDFPEPSETIPAFLVEEFQTEPPRTLRAISEHARTRSNITDTPEYARDAFALQDDQTKAAAAEYAEALADFLDAEGYDTLEAVPEEAYLDPSEISAGITGLTKEQDSEVNESEEDNSGGFLGIF